MSEKMTGTHISGRWLDATTYQLQIATGVEWVSISHTTTGEYIGWVPYGAAIAHRDGHLTVDDLRRIARPEPPEGMRS